MRDPERLLQRPSSDFTAELLRAGADEKPSAAALRRTLKVAAVGTALGASLQATSANAAALGAKSGLAGVGGGAVASGMAGGAATVTGAAVGGGVAAGAAASAAAGHGVAALTAAAIAKWVGVGALGGVVAATAAHRLAPGSLAAVGATRATPSAEVASAPLRPAAPSSRRAAGSSGALARFEDGVRASEPAAERPPVPSTAAFALEPSQELPEAARAPEKGNAAVRRPPAQPLAAAPSVPLRSAASQSGSRSTAPVLAAEVAMVDRGRAALQRGDGAGALHALASYEATFPHQQLAPEVLFLRMEALVRLGDLSQARALARRIVARGTAGPQAVRARELLGQ